MSPVVCLALAWAAVSADEPQVSFLRDVAPILTTRCAGCHGDKKGEGDYRLHTFDYLMSEGASGLAAVTAGKLEDSELFARLVDRDPATRMPQEDDPLAPAEIEAIRRWIAAGARFDGVDRAGSIKSQLPARRHPAPPEHYPRATPVYALAWSPVEDELAIGGHHEITIWNSRGKLLRRLAGLPLRVHALRFNRDGLQLLAGGGSPGDYGELTLVDPSGKQPPRAIGVFDDVVLGVAWSADDQRLAAASADRSVRVLRCSDLATLWTSRMHSDFATAVAFRDDGRFVATASKDCTVKVLDAETGKLFTTYNGHQMNLGPEAGRFPVADVRFIPGSRQALSVGEGKSIRLWEPEAAQAESGDAGDMEARFAKRMHTRYLPHGSQRPAFRLAVAAGRVFVATGDGPVRQFELATERPGPDLLGLPAWTFSLDVQPKSLLAAAGSYDGQVRVWNAEAGALLAEFTAAP